METVRLSSKGQFIIPKAIRDRNHWKAGTEFVIIDRGAELVIKPARDFPLTELEPLDAKPVYRGRPLFPGGNGKSGHGRAGKHR